MAESETTRSSLIVRLRDPRDQKAWLDFAEIYRPLIYDLARQRGLQEADAFDLVQEVFRAVARAIDRYDSDAKRGPFRGGLLRITSNLVMNLLAAQGQHLRGIADAGLQQLLEEKPEPSDDASAYFEIEYRRRLLAWATKRVRGDFSKVVWQAYWLTGVEAREPKQVARSLGISVRTLYQYKCRVVARIRREIEHIDGGSHDDF